MNIEPKPVTIISGFLGAGKTSFLNEYIAQNKGIRHFIIENEFGKESIDAELIIAPDADVFELNSGCLCCNLNEDLFDVLKELWERNTEFDELIIETTGIADPANVAQPFIVIPEIKKYYSLSRVICIVDARLIKVQLKQTEEALKQIAFADIILISKTDMTDTGYLTELEALLHKISPYATILSGNKTTGYPVEKLLSLYRSDFDSKILAPDRDSEENNKISGKAHKEHHHQGISSLTFVFDKPFNLEIFYHRLLLLLNIQANDIYRIKGILWVKNEPEKMIVQSVGSILAITPGNSWGEDEHRKSKLVFIGRDLKSKGLGDFLTHCLVR